MRAFAFLVVFGLPAAATAQGAPAVDPQSRPRMLAQGAEITDVIDAFDLGSAWSFRFGATFVRSVEQATLQRERSALTAPASSVVGPDGVTPFDTVAGYGRLTQALNLNANLALFRDVALTFGVPIILSDTQQLDPASSVSGTEAARRLGDGYVLNGAPTQLFNLPFRSPERSGIDQVRIGASFNLLNQSRDPHVPTWLVHLEWRPPVGARLSPCSADPNTAAVTCPDEDAPRPDPNDPATYDAPGSTTLSTSAAAQYARRSSGRSPGVSRGVHGLYLQTVLSRRIGYIEPYLGMDLLVEIPGGSLSAFRFGDTPYGQLSKMPPIRGSLIAGTEIVPWENRESWQRLTIDLNVRGQYVSQGRDYSQLYDALGSSNSLPLTAPQYSIVDQINAASRCTSAGCPTPDRPIYYSGTSTVQSYARLMGGIAVGIQAAKFLRFAFGGSVAYSTPHLITATDACNPAEKPGDDLARRGGCIGDAAPDPQHRPVIDAPGQRFRLLDDIVWDLFVNVALTPRF